MLAQPVAEGSADGHEGGVDGQSKRGEVLRYIDDGLHVDGAPVGEATLRDPRAEGDEGDEEQDALRQDEERTFLHPLRTGDGLLQEEATDVEDDDHAEECHAEVVHIDREPVGDEEDAKQCATAHPHIVERMEHRDDRPLVGVLHQDGVAVDGDVRDGHEHSVEGAEWEDEQLMGHKRHQGKQQHVGVAQRREFLAAEPCGEVATHRGDDEGTDRHAERNVAQLSDGHSVMRVDGWVAGDERRVDEAHHEVLRQQGISGMMFGFCDAILDHTSPF